MGFCRSRGVGQYVGSGSEVHNLVWSRLTKVGATAVLNLQGSHSTADLMANYPALNDPTSFTGALASAGFLVASGDLAQTTTQGTYGSDTVVARVVSLNDFTKGLTARMTATGKVHLMGGSGGAAAAINYARAYPSNVASIIGIAPLTAIEGLYDDTAALTATGITQAEIRTAHGAADTAAFRAMMPTRDPAVADISNLVNIPIRLYYSTNDPAIPVNTVMTFAQRIITAGGTCETISMGAVGHSADGLDPTEVVDFFTSHTL